MLIVRNICLPLGESRQAAFEAACKVLKASRKSFKEMHVHKLSVDARRKQINFVYSIAAEFWDAGREAAYFKAGPDVALVRATAPPQRKSLLPKAKSKNIVVCGMGPAGLFAALELAEAGFEPTVLEQGPPVDERRRIVSEFEATGRLNPLANVQFGEGGAGTFSDGKLVSRIGDTLKTCVLQRLVEAGAPGEIMYVQKPHVGTDLLGPVFMALRKRLLAMGGRVLFNTKLTGIDIANGRLAAVNTSAGKMPCDELVLAVGHSARDTFELLACKDLDMVAKPFSVGFRIEHLQSNVDESLYHAAAGHPDLPPGEYQLSARVNGHGVYTFCMCPGGSVVAAASEEMGLVTNGMSMHARSAKNANSAVVADIGEGAFHSALEAVEFQRELERRAYAAGGGGFAAPAENVGSFLNGLGELLPGRVEPTYPRGVVPYDLGSLLPESIAMALRQGIMAFGRKMQAFAMKDAILTGLETRTTSPLRVVRGEDLQSTSCKGLWPCGEGAGYAGGITSAAVDGVRCARAIADKYAEGI